MIAPPLYLRPFTDADWDCWSGCQSECPLVAEVSDSLTLIVDDCTVQAHFQPQDVDGSAMEPETYSSEFHSPHAAQKVAADILAMRGDTDYAALWLRRIS